MFARHVSVALLNRLREGRVELDDGDGAQAFGPPDSALRATVRMHDDRFLRALPRGSLALAEAYVDGAWDTDDLVTLVRVGAREMPRIDRWRRPLTPLLSALSRVPRNTRDGSRRHIAAHYDLGNDMFRLFLDETMTYSCAFFESPEVTLREAQEAKLDRVCRKLELGPDDELLEIGTGWGSLAMHAAGRYGCRVTTTTISQEQHDVALERVCEAGLQDRVTVLLEDYRDLRGRFDKLVSIEMIEAVGWQYLDTFFRRCAELLRPDGLMLLQAITIADRAYDLEKATRSFIKELVFPAGCLPSREVIRGCVDRVTDMTMLELEDITEHYPETLRRWRENFVRSANRAAELGYDLRFRRLWELYFAWCEGGFRERRIGDVQALLAKPSYRGYGLPLRQNQVLTER
ncbi:MAG: cyclopropane-fatty-acyl-phospholipid synthase [Thermoleophilaceae bacterium]|jgi:cyclopropane-fatty-acyl-phospholipid synthase|nr:cyclopropane-fatty-acyl-phospholipid synthase [Thermoleophilaceae bacterium]